MKVSLNPEKLPILLSPLFAARKRVCRACPCLLCLTKKNITMLNHFFGQRQKVRPTHDDKDLTILFATESDDNGNTVIIPKCVEVENNPACLLTFEDFRLQSMLNAGIKPQHLAISQDNRIGIPDSDINAFADRVNNLLSDSEN